MRHILIIITCAILALRASSAKAEEVAVYQNSEGGVSIVYPAQNTGLTLEEIFQKDIPRDAPRKIVDRSLLPQDRRNRNSWRFDASKENGIDHAPGPPTVTPAPPAQR